MSKTNVARSHPHLWLGLVLLASNTAWGAWVEDSEPEPKLSSFGTICEKTEIWGLLTGNPTVYGAQNIPFKKVIALAETQMESYEANIKLKKAELEKLEPRIRSAQEKEKVPVIDDDGLTDLIEKALQPFQNETFTGIEKAKLTECGNPKKKDRSVRRVFSKCVDGFKGVVDEKFQGELLFNGRRFHELFMDLVGSEGYCDRLCQELRDVASKRAGGAIVAESGKLLSKKEKLETELQEEEEKLGQCKAAHESILAFEGKIEEHKAEVDKRHDEFRAADALWEDADMKLEDLEDQIEESKEKLAEAKENLNSADELVTDAKAALDKVQKEEDDLKAQVEETSGKLEEVNQKLDAANNADKVVQELRTTVSVATLKMRLFFVAAALQPVEYAGLSGSTNLEEYFFPTMADAEVQMQNKLTETVQDMTTFCDEEAIPVFEKVKSPDLSPLCKTGDSASIIESIYTTTDARIKQVKQLLTFIKSWFNPLKGQESMTEEKVKEYEKAGEPEGLRAVMGVYSISKFYQYLKGWSYDGKFLALIKRLKDVTAELSASVKELEGESAKIKEQHQKVVEAREEAAKKLEEAKKEKGRTEEELAAIEKALADLEEATEKQMAELEDFEAKRDAAYERFKKAEEMLVEAHKEGTALLQEKEAATSMLDARDMLQG